MLQLTVANKELRRRHCNPFLKRHYQLSKEGIILKKAPVIEDENFSTSLAVPAEISCGEGISINSNSLLFSFEDTNIVWNRGTIVASSDDHNDRINALEAEVERLRSIIESGRINNEQRHQMGTSTESS